MKKSNDGKSLILKHRPNTRPAIAEQIFAGNTWKIEGVNQFNNLDQITFDKFNDAWGRIRNIQKPIKDLAPKHIGMGKIVSEARYNEYMNGKNISRRILYLEMTHGCEWRSKGSSGCFNCGMALGGGLNPHSSAIIKSIADRILKIELNGEIIKWYNIYNEGSFFSDLEIPPLAQETILKLIAEETDAERITIETRPEYITDDKIDMLDEISTEYNIELEVGIGVETSNDFIREYCINKGFTFEDFAHKADLLHAANVRVLAYNFFKPIFLNESEAISDAVESINAFSGIADAVSLEIAGIQEYTIMEYLWLRGEYTLPSLWSVQDVMDKIGHRKDIEIRIGGEPATYYPASKTTAFNCEKCTPRGWGRIRKYNETHDRRVLETHCDCKELWRSRIENEGDQGLIEDKIMQRIMEVSKNISYDDYLKRKSLNSLHEVM